MSDFEKLTIEEVHVLNEAMDFWESAAIHELRIMEALINCPMPPEEHESFEFMKRIKEELRRNEKDIRFKKLTRQDTATLIKAKLIFLRREIEVAKACEAFATSEKNEESSSKKRVMLNLPNDSTFEEEFERLNLCEQFIKDLGVWEHYQSFLKDLENDGHDLPVVDESELSRERKKRKLGEQYIQELGAWKQYQEHLKNVLKG